MKFSTIFLSAIALTSSVSAAPAAHALPAALTTTCPAHKPHDLCCKVVKPGLLGIDLSLILTLCGLLGIDLDVALNLGIGTQCVPFGGSCSGGKTHRCCEKVVQSPNNGLCGY